MSTPGLRGPAVAGAVLAALAAALFGLSTPLVQRAGHGLGPFWTAALLYAGAAVAGALLRQPGSQEARLTRRDLPWLAGVAFFGALVGPVALAWGLQRASGAGASLMLTMPRRSFRWATLAPDIHATAFAVSSGGAKAA